MTGGEFVGANAEKAVVASEVVLPGDGRGQLFELHVGEVLLKRGKQRFIHVGGGGGQRVGQAQDQSLTLFESRVLLKGVEIQQLLFRDVGSADGRVDVNSKRAADQPRSLDAGQRLQPRRHGVG